MHILSVFSIIFEVIMLLPFTTFTELLTFVASTETGELLTLVFLPKTDYEDKRPRLANTIVREIPGSKQT